MKSSGEQVEEYLEQIWSDDRVVQQETRQKLINDDCNMLAYHEWEQKQILDDGLDQHSTTT